MKLIYFAGLGLVVYLNLLAMTLAAGRFGPSPAIARAAAASTSGCPSRPRAARSRFTPW
jgi:hypothetical protein